MAKMPDARTWQARKRRRPSRRKPRISVTHGRRKTDFYFSVGRFAGLIGFPSIAIYAQAELIGEPMRHVVGVVAIVCTSIWAYGTQPGSLGEVMKLMRGKLKP